MIIAPDESMNDFVNAQKDVITGLYGWRGIRQEEMWQIMWIAGLITDDDFYKGMICYETLFRALSKAKEFKAARND